MIQKRQNADTREKQLRLAILRIERGRAHTKATKLTISAVARETGVTPSLIHNCYPKIAEDIRTKCGSSSRAQRDAKQAKLKQVQESKKALLEEIATLRKRIAQLASINETLVIENRGLKATVAGTSVVAISKRDH